MQAVSAGDIVTLTLTLTLTGPRGTSYVFVAGVRCRSFSLLWVRVELASLEDLAALPIVFDLATLCQNFAAQSITLRPKRPFIAAIDVA